MCCHCATAGLSAPGTDPRRRYLIKMQQRWENKIREFWKMIPPLRGGDFKGIAGLSSDDSVLVGVSTARERSFKKAPALSNIGSMSPGQIIPQHGCVPALPASVSPGKENFSGKATKAVQEQLRTKRLPSAHTGLEVKLSFLASGRGRNIFLDFPFYRPGDNTCNLPVTS